MPCPHTPTATACALASRPDSSGWVPPGCLGGRGVAGLWWDNHSMVVWLGLMAVLVLLWGAVRAADDTCMRQDGAQQQQQQQEAGAEVSSTA